jgi:hypothetical protein
VRNLRQAAIAGLALMPSMYLIANYLFLLNNFLRILDLAEVWAHALESSL